MFNLLANLIVIIISVLFPVFASYKALLTRDPALLTPWLTYWLVLAIFTTTDSLLSFITPYIPFYAWIRLILHLYLLLPGEQQGSIYLYTTQIRPVLSDHEQQIEHFISTGHDRLKSAGMEYIRRILNYVRAQMLGQQAVEERRTCPTPPKPQQSYSQSLLARFNLPSARPAVPNTVPSDIYAMLSSALAAATSPSSMGTPQSLQAADIAAMQTLIPPILSDPTERLNYIKAQTSRLRMLLGAFDEQAKAIAEEEDTSGPVKQSKSETEFEAIEHEDVLGSETPKRAPPARKASWGASWGWGGGRKVSSEAILKVKEEAKKEQ